NHMGAGIASTLLFVYPVIVALIMRFVYRERLSVTTNLCMVMAMSGIGLLYRGSDGSTLSLAGTMLVMASALSYAFYIVFTNRSNVSSLPTLTITFYVLLFGWMVFVAVAIWSGTLSTPSVPAMWANVAALAVLPTAVSLICTTGAIQLIGSTPTAILGALEPVTAVFFGVVVFGEQLTGRDMAGIILIIAGVSLIVAGGKIDVLLNRIVRMFPSRFGKTA
ncbi:MAG: DMT family transporter, partial [Paramuribaculum sp.]|nr:DMT family transporter [Paramuribaculum sp.]